MTKGLSELLLLPSGYIIFVVLVLFGINHMRIKQAKADVDKRRSSSAVDKAQFSQISGAKPVNSLGDLCKKASFCPQRCSQMLIYY